MLDNNDFVSRLDLKRVSFDDKSDIKLFWSFFRMGLYHLSNPSYSLMTTHNFGYLPYQCCF